MSIIWAAMNASIRIGNSMCFGNVKLKRTMRNTLVREKIFGKSLGNSIYETDTD